MDQPAFDAEYVQRLAEGDPSVERHFCAYFGELLFIKLRGRVRSRQLIEDVRQETFLRVLQTLRKKGGIEYPERLGGFVNSVCNNVLFESFREGKKHLPMPETWREPADTTIDPDGNLVDQERKRLVSVIIGELSEKDQTIIRRIFLEEKPKDEVCREMGVDRDYLRVLVHRACTRFRGALQRKGRAAAFPARGA